MLKLTTAGVLVLAGLALCGALTLSLAYGQNSGPSKAQTKEERADEWVVQVVAQRFRYSPGDIVLKAGEPVRLEFTSLDFIHGFKIPDLKIRADLTPGRVTVVHLTPLKAGVYDFLCDNFCGTSHEEMNGRIIVND